MRITQEKQTVKTVIDDVICNRCGKSCKASGDNPNFFYARCVADGGYGSRRFVVGHRYAFDLCEDCTIEVARGFKHSPNVRYIGLFNESDGPPEVTWEETIRKDAPSGK